MADPTVIQPANSSGTPTASTNNATASASPISNLNSSGGTVQQTTNVTVGAGVTQAQAASNTGNTGTTPAADPGSIKQLAPTGAILNPMSQYASWTYRWSWWLLSADDYNSMMSDTVQDYNPSAPLTTSFCIAEDGGQYASQRLKFVPGNLNYNIESVEFETLIGPNMSSTHTNMLSGQFVVREPYGVSLIDNLIYASANPKTALFQNYLRAPYMLQCDFVGFDDAGNPVSTSEIIRYRKRFPIFITNLELDFGTDGTTYTIDYVPCGHSGFNPEISKLPKQIAVSGSTVNEVLTDYQNQLNAHFQKETTDHKYQLADQIMFNADPLVWGSSINYSQQMSLTQASNTGSTVNITGQTFQIPAGTNLEEVITKVLIQSTYVINQMGLNLQQNGLTTTTANTQQQTQALNNVFNAYRTTCKALFGGVSSNSSSPVMGTSSFDNVRNDYPKLYSYNIHQYPIFDGAHPALPPLSDARPYLVKKYEYLYTGLNIDILDLKLHFDTTWYTAIATYTNSFGSTLATASSGLDTALAQTGSIMTTPQWLGAAGIVPGLGQVPIVNPARYKSIVTDQNATIGFNLRGDFAKETAANALKSVYSRPSGDMLSIDMTIVGDPTLIKQDDWAYVPAPNQTSDWNNWSGLSQQQFASKYGHLRMDAGALVVELDINNTWDLDTDYVNQGLMYPVPNQYTSLFSGLFKILTIKNSFSDGQFQQTLSMVRLLNSDAVRASPPSSPAATTQANQNSTNQRTTNNRATVAQPAGMTQAQFNQKIIALQKQAANLDINSAQFKAIGSQMAALAQQFAQEHYGYQSGSSARK